MEYRALEINVMSGKDLNKVNLITKMDVYVVVSISGADDDRSNQKTKTHVDHDGDNNPTWNFPIKFTIDENAAVQNRLHLVFKLRCQRALGDKDIGEVDVPIKELLESPNSSTGSKQFVSYQIRKPSGKPKGQLTFSYQFSDKITGNSSVGHIHLLRPMLVVAVDLLHHHPQRDILHQRWDIHQHRQDIHHHRVDIHQHRRDIHRRRHILHHPNMDIRHHPNMDIRHIKVHTGMGIHKYSGRQRRTIISG
ncbi:hypothetical protein T459_03026 [Capsicum annuum]|uniref:C2 domain-containing protein n=1 Tax=Capsicum annuum TaxID=4072 RepID=A0A2G3ALN5_CAPAN|nr:hypothetical protein T459_03026 [Capsicum annuum]